MTDDEILAELRALAPQLRPVELEILVALERHVAAGGELDGYLRLVAAALGGRRGRGG